MRPCLFSFDFLFWLLRRKKSGSHFPFSFKLVSECALARSSFLSPLSNKPVLRYRITRIQAIIFAYMQIGIRVCVCLPTRNFKGENWRFLTFFVEHFIQTGQDQKVVQGIESQFLQSPRNGTLAPLGSFLLLGIGRRRSRDGVRLDVVLRGRWSYCVKATGIIKHRWDGDGFRCGVTACWSRLFLLVADFVSRSSGSLLDSILDARTNRDVLWSWRRRSVVVLLWRSVRFRRWCLLLLLLVLRLAGV